MDLTTYVPTALSELKSRYREAQYDATMLIKASLETVQEVTNGEAVLLDATNPAVMLLEMGACLSANCVQENIALLRKQYAALAETEADLYMHMSDDDYLNRFATAATGSFTFSFLMTDLLSSAVYDVVDKAYKVVLPRETAITVDGVTFTTLYPIVIYRYDNGVIHVAYDPDTANPYYTLKNVSLPYTIREASDQTQWLFFTIDALQVAVTPTHFVIDKAYYFKKSIQFPDNYYGARVWYQNNATGASWIEIRTTHTDQVFDPNTPTAVLRVLDTSLSVEIPVIYLTNNAISGQLRVDLYTTKGELSLNLANFRQDNFVVTPAAMDEVRDISVYSAALSTISYYAFSLVTVTGGSSAVPFETLRSQVVYNAVGPQNFPITNVQVEADGLHNGFEIVKNIDVLTNRAFLATRKLPVPSNPKLVTAANIGIVTYTASLGELGLHDKVITNGKRTTILSKAMWLSDNSQVSLLDQSDLNALRQLGQTTMVAKINASQYLYTPYYYVLDATANEFEVRAYSLDQPIAKDLNFLRQNQTLQLFVNTGQYNLDKISTGFQLTIVTNSGNFYKGIEDNQVGVQLAFYPKGETTLAYIPGVLLSKNADEERIYQFTLETNHDFDGNNLICLTNASVQGVAGYKAWIDLEASFHLLHWTTSVTPSFQADVTDGLLGKFMLPSGAVGNSDESLVLHLGDALSNLWRRSRSYLKDTVYRMHQTNVPLLWETDVFDVDPVTGTAFTVENGELVYRYIHRKGDPVLDANSQPVLKFKAGDVMLDEQGKPITQTQIVAGRELDLLVVDGRYLFADDTATIDYRTEINQVLTSWITDSIVDVQQQLLDQTRIFFYPKTTLGVIHVLTENNGEDYLAAEQAFNVDLYVTKAIYDDLSIRDILKSTTVKLLDSYISLTTVNMSEIRERLKQLYGTAVKAFQLRGLGGVKNYEIVTVATNQNRLCLKKQLSIQADKTMIVEDAVTFTFSLVQ